MSAPCRPTFCRGYTGLKTRTVSVGRASRCPRPSRPRRRRRASARRSRSRCTRRAPTGLAGTWPVKTVSTQVSARRIVRGRAEGVVGAARRSRPSPRARTAARRPAPRRRAATTRPFAASMRTRSVRSMGRDGLVDQAPALPRARSFRESAACWVMASCSGMGVRLSARKRDSRIPNPESPTPNPSTATPPAPGAPAPAGSASSSPAGRPAPSPGSDRIDLALREAADGAAQHRRRADLLVAEHAEQLAEAVEPLLEQARRSPRRSCRAT